MSYPEKNNGRDYSLDALRGFAILTMILSGRVPFGVLPGWMYHVQVPPPLHKFDPSIPGISWVDLVFPFFLFSMGAAFPFALSKKLDQNGMPLKLIPGILLRGILLMAFALIIYHIRPHFLHSVESAGTFILAISLFALLFIIYLRFPSDWNKNIVLFLKIISTAILVIFLSFYTFSSSSGFSFRKFDIIILVLSNVAIAGSLIWIFTRGNIISKLFILFLLVGIRLSNSVEGSWIQQTGKLWPGYLLFQLYFLKYLFIIIPGMIAGDILFRQRSEKISADQSISKTLLYGIIIICFGQILISLIGLYNRQILLTTIVTVSGLWLTWMLINKGGTQFSNRFKEIFIWGALWLVTGLIFEPFEGGIKKDPSTLSYYMVTSGLAIMMLIGYSVLFNYLNLQKYFSLLIDSGKNPMLAYAAGTNLLTPLVMLTGVHQLLTNLLPSSWAGVGKGIILTLLLSVIVAFFTRKNLFWRT